MQEKVGDIIGSETFSATNDDRSSRRSGLRFSLLVCRTVTKKYKMMDDSQRSFIYDI